VVDAPAKRPRSSWASFGFPRPNDCWQIDATSWWLADGTEVKIFRVIDDHSRLLLASRVAAAETGRGRVGGDAHRVRRARPARAGAVR